MKRQGYTLPSQQRPDVTLESGALLELDLRRSLRFFVALEDDADVTLINAAGAAVAAGIAVVQVRLIVQQALAGKVLSFPVSVAWHGGVQPNQRTYELEAGSVTVYDFVSYNGGSTWLGSRTFHSSDQVAEYGLVLVSASVPVHNYGVLSSGNLVMDQDSASVYRAIINGNVALQLSGSRDNTVSYTQELEVKWVLGSLSWPTRIQWAGNSPDLSDGGWHRIQLRVDNGLFGGSIVGISNANPCAVTTDTPHGLITGNMIYINGAGGIADINNKWYHVTVTGAYTFTLDVDSTTFPAYTSGGFWETRVHGMEIGESVGGTEGGPIPAGLVFDLSDDTTPLESDVDPVYTFRVPFDLTLISFAASLTNSSVDGDVSIDIHRNGVSIFDVVLTVDEGDESSWDAAVLAEINSGQLEWEENDEIEVYLTAAGESATGLKLYMIHVADAAGAPEGLDHGQLTGLLDDDHPQYLNVDRADAWIGAKGLQSGVQFKDEGTNLGAAGNVTAMDFVGAGVHASRSGSTVTVTVDAGGGGLDWQTVTAADVTLVDQSAYNMLTGGTLREATLPAAVPEGFCVRVVAVGAQVRVVSNGNVIADVGSGNDLLLEAGEMVELVGTAIGQLQITDYSVVS